ncbi:MAG: hypothetical protein ACI4F3_08475 [Enterocloster sp.]
MNLKRILAFAGALILAGLFITAIVLAVTGAPSNYLMAVIFSIVFLTAVLYAMILMFRLLKKPESRDEDH